ncbi:divergent PAP2 family protein [Candidatus Parcubacteria bacterium]|jgi:hypothetical protein|nr:divergent PAP2 family protein [Candidatus Parcubacteria bacterium]MBT7228085.1 divergent PAP2 family protein [Candidatus Parcubacteria bacterium]
MEYKLFLIPLVIMVINQGLKVVVDMFRGEFSWPSVFSYGGMPSSHAAVVVSLATLMAHYEGLDSPAFAISLILALLTIRDAVGIRWHLGTHGKILNRLVKELPDSEEYRFPILKERFGHKSTEVIVGMMVGFALTVLAIQFIK